MIMHRDSELVSWPCVTLYHKILHALSVSLLVVCSVLLSADAGAITCNVDTEGIKQSRYYQSDIEMRLGDGFNPDRPSARFSRCVATSGTITEAASARVVSEIREIDSRADLYRSNNFDLAATYTSGTSGVSFSTTRFSDHATTRDSITYTVSAEIDYGATEACARNPNTGLCSDAYPALRPEYSSLVADGQLEQFFKRCGKFWVNRIYKKARISLIYSWDNITTSDRRTLSLGLDAWNRGGASNAELYTTWQNELANLSSTARSRVSLSVIGSAKTAIAASACVVGAPIQNLGAMRDCIARYLESLAADESEGAIGSFEVIPFELSHGLDGCYQDGVTLRDEALREIAYEMEDVKQVVKRFRNLEYEVQYGFRDSGPWEMALANARTALNNYMAQLQSLAGECMESAPAGYSNCRTPSAAALALPPIPVEILELLANDKTWSFFRWCLEAVRGTASPEESYTVGQVVSTQGDGGAYTCYRAHELARSVIALTVEVPREIDQTNPDLTPINGSLSVRPLASLPNLRALAVQGRQSENENLPDVTGWPALWVLASDLEELGVTGIDMSQSLGFELLDMYSCVNGVDDGLPCIDDTDCRDGTCEPSDSAWPAVTAFTCDDCNLSDFDYPWPPQLETLNLRYNNFGQLSALDIPLTVENLAGLTKVTRIDLSERDLERRVNEYVFSSGTYTSRSLYLMPTPAPQRLLLVPPFYSRYWYNTPNVTWYQYCWIPSCSTCELYSRPWRDTSTKAIAFLEAMRSLINSQFDNGDRTIADLQNFRVVFRWAGANLRTSALTARGSSTYPYYPGGQICLNTAPRTLSCNPAAYDLPNPLALGYPTSTQVPSCHSDTGFSKAGCACLTGLNN